VSLTSRLGGGKNLGGKQSLAEKFKGQGSTDP